MMEFGLCNAAKLFPPLLLPADYLGPGRQAAVSPQGHGSLVIWTDKNLKIPVHIPGLYYIKFLHDSLKKKLHSGMKVSLQVSPKPVLFPHSQ